RAIGGALTGTSPSGEQLTFNYQRHVEHPNGDWTWVGKLDGAEGEEALITFGERAAFGSIGQAGKPPLRLTIRDGVSWLVETDPSAVAGLNSPATKPARSDYLLPPEKAVALAANAPQTASVGTAQATPSASGPVVDVVLGYTNGFVAGLGGESQALTRLYNLIDITNQSYINSQVNAQVRLVRAVQVFYPDATDNNAALKELTGHTGRESAPVSPALQPLRQARDAYGADLVSLVRKFNDPENDGCGVAWLLGGGRTGIDGSDVPFGYSVVSDGIDAGNDGKNYFCRDETLAHELGHNMGSQHDRKTATVDGALKYGIYDYSFGFKTDTSFGNFYTIMAYGDSGQTRYRVFSNPRVNYCGGLVCGVENDADNARSLNQTIPIIASFRATVVPVPTNPGQPAARTRNDIDADGKSDLLLQNAGSGLTAYWIMSGAVPIRYSAAFTEPAGYARVATGDFNGDGRLDIVWARGTDRHLLLWQGDGNGFTQVAIGNYSAGWQVVEAGDIDADGKSDLLLQKAGSGLTAYWIMSGAVPIRYSAAFTEPAGYARVATGDFNGDGR
ncbi:MAG TPA: FG-GAP-like repeat-containing protein, partial [Xanthomonadaceae bacterium]|nr:FG-GAP-like repeat-containing protein [Xanthomonadaceae bacterium]